MKCNRCGLDIQIGMNNCPHCGNPLNYYDSNVAVAGEKTNVWLVILSVIFPFLGFILFLIFLNNQPKTAKACGLGALIAFVVEILISILMFALIFFSVSNAIEIDEKEYEYEITETFGDEDNYLDGDENNDFIDGVYNE